MPEDKLWIVTDEGFKHHLTGRGHPECPERWEVIDAVLKKAGFQRPDNTCKPRKATKEDVLLCHTEEYYDTVWRDVANAAVENIADGSYTLSTGDVQICPESLDVALLAVGAVLTAVDLIFEGKGNRVFCPVRPPGHHACKDRGMGFCIFNNVAIGARYAQKKYGIEKVLIVDWDVHHGNGTQDIFQSDPSVFYFSTHQEGIYPGTGRSDEHGIGNILNIPVETGSEAREQVIKAFESDLINVINEFQPQLIVISAGFDAHAHDPIGGLNLLSEDFGYLTHKIVEFSKVKAKGHLISVLEGGYNLKYLPKSVIKHIQSL